MDLITKTIGTTPVLITERNAEGIITMQNKHSYELVNVFITDNPLPEGVIPDGATVYRGDLFEHNDLRLMYVWATGEKVEIALW